MLTIALVATRADITTDTAPGSGRGHQVRELRQALTALGHAVTVHVPDDVDHLTTTLAEARPHIVHGHGSSSVLAGQAAARLDIPAIHSVGLGNPPVFAGSPVIVRSTGERDELIKSGSRRSEIQVVPRGVDSARFSPDGPTLPRHSGHRVVAIGAITARSGFATAVAALAGLPNAELLLAGARTDDEHAARLRAYADTHGVADRLVIADPTMLADLPALLRSADVAVSTPWHGSSDTGVLEAMACGLPVVATATAGTVDVVVDGVTGSLVPAHRPRTLARTVRRLFNNPVIGEQYGAAGHDRASTRYSWQCIAVQTIAAYQRAGVTDPEVIARDEAIRLRKQAQRDSATVSQS